MFCTLEISHDVHTTNVLICGIVGKAAVGIHEFMTSLLPSSHCLGLQPAAQLFEVLYLVE